MLTAGGDDLTDSDDEFRIAMRQMMGVFSQLEKTRLVKKLAAARARKRAAGGYAGGQKARTLICDPRSSCSPRNCDAVGRCARSVPSWPPGAIERRWQTVHGQERGRPCWRPELRAVVSAFAKSRACAHVRMEQTAAVLPVELALHTGEAYRRAVADLVPTPCFLPTNAPAAISVPPHDPPCARCA